MVRGEWLKGGPQNSDFRSFGSEFFSHIFDDLEIIENVQALTITKMTFVTMSMSKVHELGCS